MSTLPRTPNPRGTRTGAAPSGRAAMHSTAASAPRRTAAAGGAADAADWIPVMTDRIVRAFRPLKIVLFGSRARGEAHAQSDVDLLVVMPDAWAGARKREAAVGILGVLKDLPVYKDVVVTTPEEVARRGDLAGTTLRVALREGRVLYDLDAFRPLIPREWPVAREPLALATLTVWAVEARSPGDLADADARDAREAVEIARSGYALVSSDFKNRGASEDDADGTD